MKICAIVLISLVLYSCVKDGPRSYDNVKVLEWSIEESKKTDISEFLEISKVVKLEGSSEALIKRISTIEVVDDNILVTDEALNKIFIFDQFGKFNCQIGNKGHGPAEYTEISDYFCTDAMDTIGIYDNNIGKLILYDSNGAFINYVGVPRYFKEIECLNNSQYVLLNRMSYAKFKKKNKKSNLVVRGPKKKNTYEGLFYSMDQSVYTKFRSVRNLTSIGNGKVNVQEFFNDTIFVFDGKELKPRYYFDFGDFSLPTGLKEEATKKSKGNFRKFIDLVGTECVLNTSSAWFETTNNIYTSRKNGGAIFHLFINKRKNKCHIANFMSQHFIWRLLQLPVGIVQEENESYLVFSVQSHTLLTLKDKYKNELEDFSTKNKSEAKILKTAMEGLTYEDNPLLVFVRMK